MCKHFISPIQEHRTLRKLSHKGLVSLFCKCNINSTGILHGIQKPWELDKGKPQSNSGRGKANTLQTLLPCFKTSMGISGNQESLTSSFFILPPIPLVVSSQCAEHVTKGVLGRVSCFEDQVAFVWKPLDPWSPAGCCSKCSEWIAHDSTCNKLLWMQRSAVLTCYLFKKWYCKFTDISCKTKTIPFFKC